MAQSHIPGSSSAHATGVNSDAGLDPGHRPQEQQPHRHRGSNLFNATLGRIANFSIDRYTDAISAAIVGNPGRPFGHPTELFGEPAIDHREFFLGIMSSARASIARNEDDLNASFVRMRNSFLQPADPLAATPSQRSDFAGSDAGRSRNRGPSDLRSQASGSSEAHFHGGQDSDLERWRREVSPEAPEETPPEPRGEREEAPQLPPRHRRDAARHQPAPGGFRPAQTEPSAEEREAAQRIYDSMRAQGIKHAAQLVGVTAGSGQHHGPTRGNNQFLPAPREIHHHDTTHSHDGSGDGDGGDEGEYDDPGNT